MKYSKYIWLIMAVICFTGAFQHIGHLFLAIFCVLMSVVLHCQEKVDKEWEETKDRRNAR